MKTTTLTALCLLSTAILAFAPEAHATHAYRSEHCQSKTLTLRYNGNYPVGGYYGIAKRSTDLEKNELLAIPNDLEIYGQEELDSAEVIFTETASKIIGDEKESSEDGFDHSEWTSLKKIRFDRVSRKAAGKLGIRQGQYVVFQCQESTDYPNGKELN